MSKATLDTALTALVGCTIPVQQAPMGSVSTPDLAVAVADAGGIGTITALGMQPERLGAVLDSMVARTSGTLAVNFLTAAVDRDAVAVAAARVRIVDFFWSDPDSSLVRIAHDGGALACWQVGSVEEAMAAADAGVDVIAVQGREAGGHVRGDAALLPLLAAVLDAVDVPVLAAGGIGEGRALEAVLAAGAAGARMGTRFIATEESGAHPDYKAAVVAAGLGATEITDAFAALCPLCATSARHRVLRAAVDALASVEGDTVGEATVGDRVVSLPRGAALPPGPSTTGNVAAMAMYAGESAAVVRAVEPAATVVAGLVAGTGVSDR